MLSIVQKREIAALTLKAAVIQYLAVCASPGADSLYCALDIETEDFNFHVQVMRNDLATEGRSV